MPITTKKTAGGGTNAARNAKSRYSQGGPTEQWRERLGWWERDLGTLRKDDTDLFITLTAKYDKRPDTLAADWFGSSLLMWLVLQFNSIVDINEEFIAGKVIRLPTTTRVMFDYLNKRTGGVPPSTSLSA